MYIDFFIQLAYNYIRKCFGRKIMEYVWLVVGFVLLIKGADFFVDGASSIAGKLKVPSLIIGLTVVSMGTSAPEAAISISAAIMGSSDLSLGNVIGSNLFNLLMVIGICSAITPIATDPDVLKRDMPVNIGITVAFALMIIDGKLGRIDAVILLVLFVAYLFILVTNAFKNRSEESPEQKTKSWLVSIVFVVLGMAAIVFGGDLVVDNAKLIASSLGMSDTLIGLTVVALGTSLPELVTSIVASRKGESDIALGNAVGSCLFNILFVLGSAAVISPMAANGELLVDACILIGVTVLMLLFAFTKKKIGRVEGIICVSAYAAYTAYIIMRTYHIWMF